MGRTKGQVTRRPAVQAVQTFLPYPDFAATAKALDWRRLGKQRSEARQIIETLLGVSKGWANHPAVKMWHGHEAALALYLKAIIDEWVGRGYRNEAQSVQVIDDGHVAVTFRPPSPRPVLGIAPARATVGTIVLGSCSGPIAMPSWLGNEAFHASHRSNLLRKDLGYYSRFGWAEVPGLPYVWPR